MKKLAVLLIVCVMMVSLFTFASATPTLTLQVVVNTGSTLNVTYIAKLTDNSIAAPGKKIDFYTDPSGAITLFPTKYIGSAYTDNTGTAKLSIHQDRGTYIGGAIYIDPAGPAGNKLLSNIVTYIVP